MPHTARSVSSISLHLVAIIQSTQLITVASPEATPEVGAARRAVRVLVVEDEPLIAEVGARARVREGLAVDVVGDGDGRLRATGAPRCDLIAPEPMFPGRDGLEAWRRL